MKLLNGDCLTELKKLESNSVDSLVTDPPAGIAFMNVEWDKNKGGRKQWIAWMTEVMQEAHRVLKPGAYGLVWALPRTSHWTATALEDAGFDVRDVVTHLFGTGFPKSMDISKAIDKMHGAEREVVGLGRTHKGALGLMNDDGWKPSNEPMKITAPATEDAKKWRGYGTALKPANEHWILIQKPISEKTIAKNVLKHGVGGLNIDASRIEALDDRAARYNGKSPKGSTFGNGSKKQEDIWDASKGRFPTNLVLDEFAAELLDDQSGILKSGTRLKNQRTDPGILYRPGNYSPSCEASEGGASRFFYVAKASKSDREAGLDDFPAIECRTGCAGAMPIDSKGLHKDRFKKLAKNTHPTVKNTKLMEYLIKLVTPEGGTVLDPFLGSGSTGVAAVKNGFNFIGIEKELEYFNIASQRILSATQLGQSA